MLPPPGWSMLLLQRISSMEVGVNVDRDEVWLKSQSRGIFVALVDRIVYLGRLNCPSQHITALSTGMDMGHPSQTLPVLTRHTTASL